MKRERDLRYLNIREMDEASESHGTADEMPDELALWSGSDGVRLRIAV